jgi:hypothetical protein
VEKYPEAIWNKRQEAKYSRRDCLIPLSYMEFFLMNLDSITSYRHPRHYHFTTITLFLPSLASPSILTKMAPVLSTPSCGGLTRRQVCEECKITKRGCSRDRPSCSRCRTQGKECRYPDDSDAMAERSTSIADSNPDTPSPSIVAISTPCPSIATTPPVNSGLSNLALSSSSRLSSSDTSITFKSFWLHM